MATSGGVFLRALFLGNGVMLRTMRLSRVHSPALLVIGSLAVAAGVALTWWAFRSRWQPASTSLDRAPVEPPAAETTAPAIVRMSPTQIAAAGLHTSPVEFRELQDVRRVPAKLGYNLSRRLELKVPASGVVKQVVAEPGQRVRKGDALALLSSIEVGLARDEVIGADAEMQIAQRESQWAARVADNLETLLAQLEQRPELKAVEQRFQDKVLGDHRDKIVSAYSKLLLTDHVSRDTDALAIKGAISDRLVQERTSNREVAAAYFKSVCEQSKFDAAQHRSKTQAALEHAERVLAVSRQKLKLLVGPYAEVSSASNDDAEPCELTLRAPLDGLIEDRYVVEGMQLTASQPLFSVADTDTLWVSAQIYEREWSALADHRGPEVVVQIPSLPDYSVTARVQFTGVSLSADTRAVPLVAEIPNPDQRLKPGMFAWVTVPLGPKLRELTVPASAVQRHEEETFVFVEQTSEQYRKAVVELGLVTPDWAAVRVGLQPGERVVDRGAFYLKSEMLLEGEEP